MGKFYFHSYLTISHTPCWWKNHRETLPVITHDVKIFVEVPGINKAVTCMEVTTMYTKSWGAYITENKYPWEDMNRCSMEDYKGIHKADAANFADATEDLGDEEGSIDDNIIPKGIDLNKCTNFVDMGDALEKELKHLGIFDSIPKMSIKKTNKARAVIPQG
eukprot:15364651-Ditylum_brightwellii.AAC.1